MRYLLLFFLAIVITASCSTKKQSANTNQPKTSDCKEMIMLEKPVDSLRIDFYDIDSLNIIDLHLALTDNDPCRSIVQKKLTFSLEPFKRFADRGGIYFKIAGTEKSVLYQIPK